MFNLFKKEEERGRVGVQQDTLRENTWEPNVKGEGFRLHIFIFSCIYLKIKQIVQK